MLFVSPQGRVAYWAGWKMLGLSKDQYSEVHTTFMILFLVTGIWHIVLNWKPIVGYMKNRSKQVRFFTPESTLAMLLTAAFLVGPLAGLFPFRQYLDAGADVKAYWESNSGSPPWGHAEENSLQRFCRGMEDFERLENGRLVIIDCDAALEALRSAGLQVVGLSQRLVDMAEANNTTPRAVAEIVMGVARPATPEEIAAGLSALFSSGDSLAADSALYRKPYSGLGRMSLREYGQEYSYDVDTMVGILESAGLSVNPDATLREEATRLGTDPEGLISVLNAGG
jgi:hypothetical protein